MKKKILYVLLIGILLLNVVGCGNNKSEEIKGDLSSIGDLNIEINSEVMLLSLIKNPNNLEIVSENKIVDTSTLGEQKLTIRYKKDNKEKEYIFKIKIVDTENPIIDCKSSLTTKKGTKIDLLKDVTVTDNSNENIEATVEGKYDFNKTGTYNLKYVAIDGSGNKSEKEFTLTVTAKNASSSNTNTTSNSNKTTSSNNNTSNNTTSSNSNTSNNNKTPSNTTSSSNNNTTDNNNTSNNTTGSSNNSTSSNNNSSGTTKKSCRKTCKSYQTLINPDSEDCYCKDNDISTSINKVVYNENGFLLKITNLVYEAKSGNYLLHYYVENNNDYEVSIQYDSKFLNDYKIVAYDIATNLQPNTKANGVYRFLKSVLTNNNITEIKKYAFTLNIYKVTDTTHFDKLYTKGITITF